MEEVGYYNYALEEFRSKEFPALKDVTYVDHAGATLYSLSQLNAVHSDLSSHLYGNPHSGSPASKLTSDTVDNVRYRILKFFNTTPDQYTVIFTSGCTGALKLLGESFSFSKRPPPVSERNESEGKHHVPAEDHSEAQPREQLPTSASPPPPPPENNQAETSPASPATSEADTPDLHSRQQQQRPSSSTSTTVPATKRPAPAFVPLAGYRGDFPQGELQHHLRNNSVNEEDKDARNRRDEDDEERHEENADEGWRAQRRESRRMRARRRRRSKAKAGCFYYLQDNHTSVQGMRELVADRCRGAICVTESEVTGGLSWDSLVLGGHPGLDGAAGWDDAGDDGDGGHYDADWDVVGDDGDGRRDDAGDDVWQRSDGGGDWSGNSLFVFPGQSNFSGRKYPLRWVPEVQAGSLGFQAGRAGARWFVALDAASLVSTSPLDLIAVQPDFVTLSFYKIFGFPTGLGALLVKNSSSWVLDRRYYGGGTVAASIARERFCALKAGLSDRFEDGTLPYLDIVAVRHGLNTLHSLGGNMDNVSSHTFLIAQFFARNLTRLTHSNGAALAEVYTDGSFEDRASQGAIVNFNLKRANGEYIGFAEVDKLAQLHDIQLRTGCFCNIGACQAFLGLASSTIKANLRAGHVCGDDMDLIDGRPTGSVRISFGYMSTLGDASTCLRFVVRCFLQDDTPSSTDLTSSLSSRSSPLSSSSSSTLAASTSAYKDAVVFPAPDWFKPPLDSSKAQSSDVDRVRGPTTTATDWSKPEAESSSFTISSQQAAAGSRELEGGESSPLSDWSRPQLDSSTSEKTSSQQAPDRGEGAERQGDEEGHAETGEEFECSEKRRKLTDIFLYPVKSCGAFRVTQWELGDRGLLYDRTWMVVSESGVVLSQKREPHLCLLLPLVHLASRTLELTFPGMTSLSVPLDVDVTDSAADDINICTNKICNDRVTTVDCGDRVAGWLSDTLGRPGLRLFRQLDQDSRQSRRSDVLHDTSAATVEEGRQSQLSLANECQFLVLSRESVRSLQKKLAENLEDRQVETKQSLAHSEHQASDEEDLVARFRANLVIDGGLPFDEDRWTSLTCGQVSFIGQGQCSRCGMICLNQKTGEKTREPLRTLAAWRRGKVYFGVYMRAQCEEARPMLKVGSEVTVA